MISILLPVVQPLLSVIETAAVHNGIFDSFVACIEYAFALRVPLVSALAALALPVIAFRSPTRALLRGLFDVTPFSLFAVTLAAAAVSGTITDTAAIIYLHAFERLPEFPQPHPLFPHVRLVVAALLCLPVVFTALIFSFRQRGRNFALWLWIAAPLVGLISSFYLQQQGQVLAQILIRSSLCQSLVHTLSQFTMFRGYVPTNSSDPWIDHVGAFTGFSLSFVTYVVLGWYGWRHLGKSRTVPALCSVLLLLMLFCWTLAGLSFFFDFWRIPLLLVLLVVGLITAQSGQSDHFYTLLTPEKYVPPPTPKEVLQASATPRIIVVAANGGGIQAGAWAAQVLQGLRDELGSSFTQSVRMISSVSGGSVGSACFVYSLAEGTGAQNPAVASAQSSLDEVAWGLGWPDLIRSIFPWISRKLMGRGRALEKAWCLNSAVDVSQGSRMDRPLSEWNPKVVAGNLPAVIFNATVAESGSRLLLGTTRMNREHSRGRARVDAADLHTLNGEQRDVSVVTAARLSATFPYVTPASRSDAPGAWPHIVDGGYYDNYGMSTLVEWLDEGLAHTREPYSVLVLQIHGAPVVDDTQGDWGTKIRGWFYQAIAPISTLATVRSAGQIAHNDTELTLLQEKWSTRVPIHTVTFEYPDPKAPLSWHLCPGDQLALEQVWSGTSQSGVDQKLLAARQLVRNFLAGSDALGCPCPVCRNQGHIPDQFKAFARGVS